MKTQAGSFWLKFFVILFAFGMIACEGEVGPAGPAGPQGDPGQDGQDGQNGVENCTDCHSNDQAITAKLFQWENSLHSLGGHYERNTATCAGCHTSQGFLDRIATGDMVASMDIDDPLPPNCYACHDIHNTYTSADWAYTAGEPVTIWNSGVTVDIGKGNQCLSCHQPRIPDDGIPEVGQTGDFTITSSRYGPHHGAQGTMFVGVDAAGAYEIGEGYTNSQHTTLVAESCITCHMATVIDGRGAGGHTFRVVTEEGDLNANGCVACHSDTDELENKVIATQMEVEDLMAEISVLLRAKGILNADTDGRSVPGTYDAVVVGSYYNYIFVFEDKSGGVHNANYAKTLLENSIAALQ